VRKLVSVWLGATCIAVVMAPSAEAHKLTSKKAEAALKPIAAQLAPELAPKIAAKLPGATIASTSVDCKVDKKKHGADCAISFELAGTTTGETVCSLPARVKFRSKTSKELKIAVVTDAVACFFVMSLE